MRRAAVALVTALVVAVLTGCGAVNKGTAFSSQFQPFLDDRENVAESSISASNNLPWAGTAGVLVTLVDGLDDDEIVDEVWEITAHEVDDHISYSLQISLTAENADGEPARTSFELGVPGPAPDDDALRDDIADLLDRAQTVVALGAGVTDLESYSSRSVLTTQADALTTAEAACSNDELADLVATLSVEGAQPTGQSGRVVMNAADDCDWLGHAREVLVAVGEIASVASYEVTVPTQQTRPRLRVSIPSAEGLDLSGAETVASRLGLTLEAVSV